MADVYKVKAPGHDGFLALKLLPFQFLSDRTVVQRFLQESRRACALNHPNVTRILAYGEDLAEHYSIMELATGWRTEAGRTILDVSELTKPLPEAVALDMIKQACDGLDYLHQEGILHRDIKPGNLLLFEGGQVKLADFGVARWREAVTLTATGLLVGTPEYMSPEQAEGHKDLTHASDIYSLGVVMYELLTGLSPFKRKTPLATSLAQVNDAAPLPKTIVPGISAVVQGIVMRCLDKSPDKRFESVRQLYQAIDVYSRALPPGLPATEG
jgi:serine/threonine-protein kinase